MLYIEDYNRLNDLVSLNQDKSASNSSLQSELSSLIGKKITVYVDHDCRNAFTGILIHVFSDRIYLITSIPNGPPNCRTHISKAGTIHVIFLNHVSALAYSYV